MTAKEREKKKAQALPAQKVCNLLQKRNTFVSCATQYYGFSIQMQSEPPDFTK